LIDEEEKEKKKEKKKKLACEARKLFLIPRILFFFFSVAFSGLAPRISFDDACLSCDWLISHRQGSFSQSAST
jgi:hypothetical protein